MAYPAYDGYSRSLSRRQSLGYGTPGYQYADPYVEPMMPGYGAGEVGGTLRMSFDLKN